MITFLIVFKDGNVWQTEVKDDARLHCVMSSYIEEPLVEFIEILAYHP